jgi:predicted AAA+ superfamily ATPase
MGEIAALEQLQQVPSASFAHSKLLRLFHSYSLIGGMPEIVSHYSAHKDLSALASIYDSLITSYMDDVEKYASNATQIIHLRHVIRTSFAQAGKRIKFAGFGNAEYRSREMGESLRTLEKALLVHLLYPNTGATLPLLPDIKKSPRLQVLDTGMMNFFVGIQKEISGTVDLNNVYQGTMIEHLVGQELLSMQHQALSNLFFWARDKKESSAEVDYLFPYNGKLIPAEVKSGSAGKLKSLHLFMDMAPHTMAVRFYAGEISITDVQTITGKKYHLLNLPYYLATQLNQYLEWFEQQIKNKQ